KVRQGRGRLRLGVAARHDEHPGCEVWHPAHNGPCPDRRRAYHYAAGYMFKQVQPRLAMATHLAYDEELVPEMVAGVRAHWDGLFQFGAPDGVIVNVTKKAIWTRKAALPESTNFARPRPRKP